MSEENFPFRTAIFSFIERYGSRILDESSHLHDLFVPFFANIFACQNHPNKQAITPENITNEEKMIIRGFFLIFLVNLTRCRKIRFLLFQREFLSGLVLFRVEILPMFHKIVDPDQKIKITHPMLCLHAGEKQSKAVILDGHSKGHFKGINLRYFSSVTENVRSTHKWWNADYSEFDDQIGCLSREYKLED